MIKNADDTGHWVILDGQRGQDEELYAQISNAELANEPNRTSFDSDGLIQDTVRNGRYNNNGDTFYIYGI